MTTLITIITPSFNQGRYIERTIKSVLGQNIPQLEYLIMDGGSTDETTGVLERYHDQLRWVSEPDKGQAHAINKGLELAKGEIIGWLNSDDIYYPQTLHTVCDYFATHPETDVIYGNAYLIDSKDKIVETHKTEPWHFKRLKEVCYICQPTVFIRRRVIEQFGRLNEDLHYCMDYEYWLRLGQCKVHFVYLPKILAGSRIHAETKSTTGLVEHHREIMAMFQRRFGRIPTRWFLSYAHAVTKIKYPESLSPWRRAVAILGISLVATIRWSRLTAIPWVLFTYPWVLISAICKKIRPEHKLLKHKQTGLDS